MHWSRPEGPYTVFSCRFLERLEDRPLAVIAPVRPVGRSLRHRQDIQFHHRHGDIQLSCQPARIFQFKLRLEGGFYIIGVHITAVLFRKVQEERRIRPSRKCCGRPRHLSEKIFYRHPVSPLSSKKRKGTRFPLKADTFLISFSCISIMRSGIPGLQSGCPASYRSSSF